MLLKYFNAFMRAVFFIQSLSFAARVKSFTEGQFYKHSMEGFMGGFINYWS